MKTFTYIERTPINPKSREPIETEQLYDLIKQNLNGLISIKNQNTEAMQHHVDPQRSKIHNQYLCYHTVFDDHTKSGIQYYQRLPVNGASDTALKFAQMWTTKILDEWIVMQISALTTIEQENRTAEFSFLEEIDLISVGPWQSVVLSKTMIGTVCEDCGYIIPASTLKSHVSSLKCMQASNDKDLRDAGWQTVSLSHYINAIKKAGVDFEVRATGFTVWIPPWVSGAISKYEEKDGYAGLKLHEFLTKIKAEKDD